MAITAVYYGGRENMIAEVAAWNPTEIGIPNCECRYLVIIVGDEQFDTEWFATKKYARNHARYLAKEYNVGLRVV